MSIKTENISIEDLIEKVKSYDDNNELKVRGSNCLRR